VHEFSSCGTKCAIFGIFKVASHADWGFWPRIWLNFGTQGFSGTGITIPESKVEKAYIQNIEMSKNGIYG
jgi:hypothetical protein